MVFVCQTLQPGQVWATGPRKVLSGTVRLPSIQILLAILVQASLVRRCCARHSNRRRPVSLTILGRVLQRLMQLPFGCSLHTEADAGFEAKATRSMQVVTSKTAAFTNVPVMLHLNILVALLSPGLILLDSTHSHQIAIFVAVATTLNTLTCDRCSLIQGI